VKEEQPKTAMAGERGATGARRKFDDKRERLIVIATRVLNEQGVRGMTLAEVAKEAGMVTTNVAYYFRKKETLAAACFTSGLDRLERLAVEASSAVTARERLSRFWRAYFDLSARIARGLEPDVPIFSDIRTLSEPLQGEIRARYFRYMRAVRELLRGPDLAWLHGAEAGAHTNIIVEQINWTRAWLPRFEVEDYSRICERMLDILLDGLAGPDARCPADAAVLPSPHACCETAALEGFLIAATRQINEHGYKGASVNRISAVLKRTKGAFYHHLNSKDDLVVAGFERTFRILREAQSAALDLNDSAWMRLHAVVCNLLLFQLSPRGPLMRNSALQSLPEPMRQEMIREAGRISGRFAAMVSDGVAEGVLRPVDPLVAAQMLTAAINAAADLHLWGPKSRPEDVAPRYATPILRGVFARNPTSARVRGARESEAVAL
jgi:AcrR family transcriptional regulator